jgi:hypothetical protein
MTTTQTLISEFQGADPVAVSTWYGGEDTISPPAPELVIDLARLMSKPFEVHGDVYLFLIDHGVADEAAREMANKLILALPHLHPATLGVIVKSLGAGHWQILAERGQ